MPCCRKDPDHMYSDVQTPQSPAAVGKPRRLVRVSPRFAFVLELILSLWNL
jgi:hypothetical protein